MAMNSNLSTDFGYNETNFAECNKPSLTANGPMQVTAEDPGILFRFIASSVLLNIVGVLGILGNVISVMVLSRPQMKSSLNCLLIGIAASDTVFVITRILLFGLPSIYSTTGYLFNYNYHILPIIISAIYPATMISQTVSVYLALIVALGRFVAVWQPLRARSLCTYTRARLYVYIVLVFSILYNITRFWEMTIKKCMNPGDKVLIRGVYFSALRKNQVYIRVYIQWMYWVFMYGLPVVTFVLLHWCIYWQVRKAHKVGEKISRQQRKTIRLTVALSSWVMIFLLVSSVPMSSNILDALHYGPICLLFETGNLLVTIHSSSNFIICLVFIEKFKEQFYNLLK